MAVACLIVDRSRYFAEGLSAALTAHGVLVDGWTSDVQAAELLVARRPIDVVVAALEPTAAALNAVKRLSAVPVVVLLPAFDATAIAAGVRAGAAGVDRRDRPPDELAAALRAAARGHLAVPPDWIQQALSQPVPRPRLTAREHEVVQLLVDGLSTKALAGMLGIAPQTAKNHLQHAMGKVGVESRVQLCSWAITSGFEPRTRPQTWQ